MGYGYAVLGAGRQGIAAAYDLALHGESDTIILADKNRNAAHHGAKRLNALLGEARVTPRVVDAADTEAVRRVLDGAHGLLSAVPFTFNEELVQVAVDTGTHMVDLGGHTGVVRRQLLLDAAARAAGICVVPDCGMGPGMNITLALAAMELLDETTEVRIYDGGLPQEPQPPWGYSLLFHIGGLLNEYDGMAYYLREGQVVEVPALDEREEIDISPLGRLEAFVTSGGLSTMPWTFEGRLRTLENKTLRYPGHCDIFRALRDTGLFSTNAVVVDGVPITPRSLLQTLLTKRLSQEDVRDVCIIHVRAHGTKQGCPATARVHLVDTHDALTGFLAMEKLTGWHAAIVLELAVKGELEPGAHPVETALPPSVFLAQAAPRGWHVEQEVTPLTRP